MPRVALAMVLAAAGCAAESQPDDDPEGGSSSAGDSAASLSDGDGDDGDGDDDDGGPLEIDCYDAFTGPGMAYETSDDPRLTDPEYEWTRQLIVGSECAGCHVAEGSPKPDAPLRWNISCVPAWTDSAEDEMLDNIIAAATANNLREAATDAEIERLVLLIEAEAQRRADAR